MSRQTTVSVTVKAVAVEDNRNGTFTIRMAGTPFNAEQHKQLRTLFPNLTDRAYALLEQELLLSALATQDEIVAPPSDTTPVVQGPKSKY